LEREEVEEIRAPHVVVIEEVVLGAKRIEDVLTFVLDPGVVAFNQISFYPSQFVLQSSARRGEQVRACEPLA
jgi:hypothetical protein